MIHRRCNRSLLLVLPLLFLLSLAFSAPAADTTVARVDLTSAERQWLKDHPVITLAPDPDFKPIEYFDKNGTYQGAAADIIRILEKKLGITITVVHLKNWDEAMEKFKKQEVDLLGAMVRTPNREKFALFTETLVAVPGGIFARQGSPTNLTLKDLTGKKVAVVSNYAAHDIIRNQYPELTLEVVPDVSTGLAKASLGMVDVYVENMANATFYSREAGITNLQVAGRTEFDYRWGIGVRKDWPELQGILNKGLAVISEEERAQAIQRWIFIEGQRWRPTKTFIIGAVALSLGLLLGLVVYWNYALRKVVRSRTSSLQEELAERQKAEDSLKTLADELEERVRERTAELQQEIRERQQAEEALQSSERRFKALIRNSSDSITILDRDGIQIFVSDVVEKMLGYKPAELLNIPVIAEMIHPDDQDAVRAAFEKILQEGVAVAQYRHRHKNGSWIYLEAWGTNQLENPDIRGVVVNVRDITDRKRAEEALHQNEITFRKLFEDSSDAILLIDSMGVFVECNQAALDLLKMTREQFLLLSPARISPEFQPDGRRSDEAALDLMAQAYNKGLLRFDWTHVNAEGIEFIVEVSLMPITLRGQTLLHTTWRDITERKRAEQVLQFSEQKFSTIFNLLPDMVGITRMANGCFIEVNDGFERWTGWKREEALGKSSLDLGVWDHKARAEAVAILQEQGHLEEFEFTMRTKSGELRSALMYLLPIIVQDEKCLFFLARDVTEHKRAVEERISFEKQLLHAQKLESLGVLAGGIAHDFNNILTAIIGNADLAMMRLNPESPVLDNLQRIEKAAARAADLARQMLAYSGKGKFVVEQIDLNRLVEEMGHILEVSVSKKALLRYNLTPSLPPVKVDATQIRQIVMNLVINAAESIGDDNGVVAITTGCMECSEASLREAWLAQPVPTGPCVYLEVSDTGCGMDRETLEKIFDPFFTTKFTGRGLGMAAVLGIIRGHKGAIKVWSEPGKGSSFKVFLPVGTLPAEQCVSLSGRDSWRGCGAALLVDDEAPVRNTGAEMLRELGFEVVTADDGSDALEKFKARTDFRLVILDLTMPRMDGEQCFRELRKLDPDVRIVISSGFSEYEVTQKFVDKGQVWFIQKPYNLSTLTEILIKCGAGEP